MMFRYWSSLLQVLLGQVAQASHQANAINLKKNTFFYYLNLVETYLIVGLPATHALSVCVCVCVCVCVWVF